MTALVFSSKEAEQEVTEVVLLTQRKKVVEKRGGVPILLKTYSDSNKKAY